MAHELEARLEQRFDLFWFLCHFHGEVVARRFKHCPFDIYVYLGARERLVAKEILDVIGSFVW